MHTRGCFRADRSSGIVTRGARPFNRRRRVGGKIPGNMPDRALGRPLLVWALLLAVPTGARAQSADYHAPASADRPVSVGGEVLATAAPRDADAYFNYTDYDHDALRLLRIRLFGEWRASDRLSLVGELRTENTDAISAAALYVRWRPSQAHDFFVQAGRIPPVFGSFGLHAYGRDNVVIGQPLAYQYLTSLRPDALPGTIDDLLRMRGRGWQPSFTVGSTTLRPGIALVSASRWDTGLSATWRTAHLDLAGALTRGAPSIPVVRDRNGSLMWAGRVAAHLPAGVTIGLSGARGQWIDDHVLSLVSSGPTPPSAQAVVGTDVELGLGRWLVRSEWIHSTFELPIVVATPSDTRLGAWGGFVEGRYRLLPRWQIGVRLDRVSFSRVQGTASVASTTWDAGVDRAEAVLGFRASRSLEFRGGWQQNWRDGGRVHQRGGPIASFLYWF